MPNARPCDVHTNCVNEGCHLLLFNVNLARKMEGCCSQNVYRDSFGRRNKSHSSIKMEIRFSKRKIRCLTFKIMKKKPRCFLLLKKTIKAFAKRTKKLRRIYWKELFLKPSIGQFLMKKTKSTWRYDFD
jgi:UPF0176 protein